MSLTQALNSAISGLNTAQARISIASSNISNVNTPGYSKKIAGQETLVLDGVGAGSQIGDIYRNVNEGLVREMRGELGKAEAPALNSFNAFRLCSEHLSPTVR